MYEKESIFYLILLCVNFLTLTSCEKEVNDIYIDVTQLTISSASVSIGDVFEASVRLKENIPVEMKIDKVEFYWKGEKIGEAISAPFTLQHEVKKQSLEEVEFKVVTNLSVNGGTQTETLSMPILVEKPKFGFSFSFPMSIKNGTSFSCSAKIAPECIDYYDARLSKVEFYWDGKEVIMNNSDSFDVSLTVSDAVVGIHQLGFHCYWTGRSGRGSNVFL